MVERAPIRSKARPRQLGSKSFCVSLFNPLIQRLQNSRVHRSDHVHGRIELFFTHSRFPCVRKAPLHSRIAKPHHRDGEADKHLLPLGEAGYRMRITIELAKVGFVHVRHSFFAALEWWSIGVLGLNASLHYSNLGSRVSYFPRPAVLNSGPETRDSERETIFFIPASPRR